MKKLIVCLLAVMLVLASATCAFADIDYSQWNSSSVYPSDVINTTLAKPVIWLVDNKIVDGYDDGLFHADWNITRAQFAKMMLIATNNQNDMASYSSRNTFSDTTSHWAHDYIEVAAAKGFINGYGDGTFKPDDNVSYVEAVAIFCRMRGISVNDSAAAWPNNYIQQARLSNLYAQTQTVTNWTTADWNEPASREDIAWLLYRNLPK